MPKFIYSSQIEKRYLEKFAYIVADYEAIKKREHTTYKKCSELFSAHRMDRRIFNKYYHRYLESGRDINAFIPRRRGPRFQSTRRELGLEEKVIELRHQGHNRYVISNALKSHFSGKGLSPSSIYNMLKQKGLNKLVPKMKQARRTYVKERAGQLGHVDCHFLGDKTIAGETKKRYLVALMDDATRIVYVEVIDDIKALTVMFAILRIINVFVEQYGIKFESIMTDNGSEFGRKSGKDKENHPFERMLMELGIKHYYTPPYKPQVNGKIERFWKTIYEDMIDADYDSIEEFKDQLIQYCVYYNHERTHQGLNHKTPVQVLETIGVQPCNEEQN
jgi:transposase InsO family protein